MGFDDLIRSGVALADTLTGDLQDTIQFSAWTGSGIYGEPTFATAIPMQAIVEEKEYLRKLGNGQEIAQKAQVTIPRPIAANGAADRREPIDPRDKIVLPSGFTGPILDVEGITDPETNNPYMYVVILG